MRAALTLLGTIIGAASIVLLAGLLRSGQEMLVNSSQSASEADLITVTRDVPPLSLLPKVHHELYRGDEENVVKNPLFQGVRATGESTRELQAEPLGDHSTHDEPEGQLSVRMVSADSDAVSLYRLEVAKGRGINEDDIAERRRVCVVGSTVWKRLFGDETALTNQRLRIENHEWSIVGVLKSKSGIFGGDGTWMWNRKALIPRSTYDAMFRADHGVDKMYVRLKTSPDLVARVKQVEKLLQAFLERTHNVDNITVKSQNSSEGQEQLILAIVKGLLLSTALLSLFVGGINIMNIMLVTVTERTREIGLRRALGATPANISLQFLLEATFIAGVGGLAGVLSGVGFTFVLSKLVAKSAGTFAFHVETWSVVLGFALSLVTGVVFGVFPAIRASRLDPVEALRFE